MASERPVVFMVTRARGAPFDPALPLEAQAGWDAHAAFMDALHADGFALLVGPLVDSPEAVLVVRAKDEAEVHTRLAKDPWTTSGHLVTTRLERWQIRLGALAPSPVDTGSPLDVALDDQHAFVARALGRARRVLEVGAGRGALARRLQSEDREVTAVDTLLPGRGDGSGVEWVERDFLHFESSRPFDAVAFTTSLHHIRPLDAALDRAARLLVPGGALILDEFDVDAPDEDSARWLYELEELLAVAGAYDSGHAEAHHARSALERWHADHQHGGERLHSGKDMLAGVEKTFVRLEVTRGAYLYRYLCRGLSCAAVARHVRAVEERRIRDGSLRPVGMQVVARKA